MKRTKVQNDIPLEALLKYIKAERDDCMAKLDKLIPYTKALEKEVASLKEQLQKKLETIDKQETRINELNREIIHSPMYKALQERYIRVKRDNTILQLQIGKLNRERDDRESSN